MVPLCFRSGQRSRQASLNLFPSRVARDVFCFVFSLTPVNGIIVRAVVRNLVRGNFYFVRRALKVACVSRASQCSVQSYGCLSNSIFRHRSSGGGSIFYRALAVPGGSVSSVSSAGSICRCVTGQRVSNRFYAVLVSLGRVSKEGSFSVVAIVSGLFHGLHLYGRVLMFSVRQGHMRQVCREVGRLSVFLTHVSTSVCVFRGRVYALTRRFVSRANGQFLVSQGQVKARCGNVV